MKSKPILIILFLVSISIIFTNLANASTLTNGNFENSTTGWTFNQGTGTASHSIVNVSGNNMSRVILTTKGDNVQLFQNGFTLLSDTRYRLKFNINSTATSVFSVYLKKYNSPYTSYGLSEYNTIINSTTQSLVYNFITSGFTGSTTDVRLQFLFDEGVNGSLYYIDNVTLETVYISPSPTNLTATQGNFWINYTWSAGTGNVTDSFNVSQNGTWTNGSSAPFLNTTISPHNWSNITVYAYNNSGEGELNLTAISDNTQLTNNLITLSNISSTYIGSIGSQIAIYPTYNDSDSDTPTFASSTTKGNFTSSNGTFLWTPQAGDNGTYNWYINVSDGYSSVDTINFSVSVNSNTPGTPIDITSTTGNFWVNTTWSSSVNTDSYNISFNNGSYLNGSASNYINLTLSPHAWSNITVWGYNLSADELGNSSSLSTQIPNNAPTIESSSISTSSITTVQSLTITATNVSDLDNDTISSVNVSVLFNIGGTTNYSMSNTEGNSWTYSYSSATAGSYTVTAITITDNQNEVTINTTSIAFTVTTPPATVVAPSGSGSSPQTVITLNQTSNNTNLENLVFKLKELAPALPEGMQQLIAECFVNGTLLNNKCSTTFISNPINYWPSMVGALTGAFISIFSIMLIYRVYRNLLIDTLLYGVISIITIQVIILVGFNMFFLNYIFQTDQPSYMFISSLLETMIISFGLDKIFNKKTRRV
jgi:hypothetical protein